eukprot:3844862-Prymnesium_polylepis.2
MVVSLKVLDFLSHILSYISWPRATCASRRLVPPLAHPEVARHRSLTLRSRDRDPPRATGSWCVSRT